jgi:hypothetical protein
LLKISVSLREAILKYQRGIRQMARKIADFEARENASAVVRSQAAQKAWSTRRRREQERKQAKEAEVAHMLSQYQAEDDDVYDHGDHRDCQDFDDVHIWGGVFGGGFLHGMTTTSSAAGAGSSTDKAVIQDDKAVIQDDKAVIQDDHFEAITIALQEILRHLRDPDEIAAAHEQYHEAIKIVQSGEEIPMEFAGKRKREMPKTMDALPTDCKEVQIMMQRYVGGFDMAMLKQMLQKCPSAKELQQFRDIIDVKHVNWETVGTRVWNTFPEPIAAQARSYVYSSWEPVL